MYIKPCKETAAGKLIAAAGWILTAAVVCAGSVYAVTEELSLESLMIAAACLAPAAGVFIGMQILATKADDRLLEARLRCGPEEQDAVPAADAPVAEASFEEAPAVQEQPTETEQKPADEPTETETRHGFMAAGEFYHSTSELQQEETERLYIWRDIHGRKVVCFNERFPCFDVYDRLYENRYFWWFLIPHNGTWTRVYKEDGSSKVEIREGLNMDAALAGCRCLRNARDILMAAAQHDD